MFMVVFQHEGKTLLPPTMLPVLLVTKSIPVPEKFICHVQRTLTDIIVLTISQNVKLKWFHNMDAMGILLSIPIEGLSYNIHVTEPFSCTFCGIGSTMIDFHRFIDLGSSIYISYQSSHDISDVCMLQSHQHFGVTGNIFSLYIFLCNYYSTFHFNFRLTHI